MRSVKDYPLGVRISLDLQKQLKELALLSHRSLSNVVAVILAETIKNDFKGVSKRLGVLSDVDRR